MMARFSGVFPVAFAFACLSMGCQSSGQFWEQLSGEGYKTKDSTLDAPLRPKSEPRPWWDRPLEKRAQEIDDRLGR
jgi:hypothetical protein